MEITLHKDTETLTIWNGESPILSRIEPELARKLAQELDAAASEIDGVPTLLSRCERAERLAVDLLAAGKVETVATAKRIGKVARIEWRLDSSDTGFLELWVNGKYDGGFIHLENLTWTAGAGDHCHTNDATSIDDAKAKILEALGLTEELPITAETTEPEVQP